MHPVQLCTLPQRQHSQNGVWQYCAARQIVRFEIWFDNKSNYVLVEKSWEHPFTCARAECLFARTVKANKIDKTKKFIANVMVCFCSHCIAVEIIYWRWSWQSPAKRTAEGSETSRFLCPFDSCATFHASFPTNRSHRAAVTVWSTQNKLKYWEIKFPCTFYALFRKCTIKKRLNICVQRNKHAQ